MENWIEIRLDRINKKLSVLQNVLFDASQGLETFIESEDKRDLIDNVIYGQETIEGICELLSDVKNDLISLIEQIQEEKENQI